ncbi:MAG: hypothetical protein Q3983_00015 [Capnocytophaga sp.]|nr:hypothetical protein [Capnocytophaga sp.]
MKKIFYSLLVAGAIVAGCSKDDNNSELQKKSLLEIQTNYSFGTSKILFNSDKAELATGINVSLYKTEEDLKNKKNKVASGITNQEGKVTFDNILDEGEYYVEATHENCISNIIEIEEGKAKIKVRKYIEGLTDTHSVRVDKLSYVNINNNLGESIYIQFDYESKKEFLIDGTTYKKEFVPSILSDASNYLNHTIKLYKNVTDALPFREIPITAKGDCSTLNVDLGAVKKKLTIPFVDSERNYVSGVRVSLNGEVKYTDEFGEVVFEVSDAEGEVSYTATTACQNIEKKINVSSFKNEDIVPPTVIKPSTGKFVFYNSSTNPYTISLGVKTYTIKGKAELSVDALIGTHTIKIEQQSGHLFPPTKLNYTKTLNCQDSIKISFP